MCQGEEEETDHDEDEDEEEDSEESSSEEEESSSEEEKEEEDRTQMKQKEYFAQTTFQNNRHHWLCGYYRYLERPVNGKKTERQRLQHVSQVSSLLEFLDPSGTDILILGEDEGDAPWLRWAKPACDNKLKASGTIISYLTSLEKFYVFVTNPRYTKSMPPLHPSYVDCFKNTLPGLKGWRVLMDATTQDDQHRRNLRERKEIITPEELNDLQESEPYKNGLNAIQKASLGKDLTVMEFAKARDLLLVKLILTLGPRPRPLENVILEDWENAEVCDGVKVLLVPKHKRSRTGLAPLACDADLQRLMETYIQKIRPNFVADESIKQIFLKNDGFPFERGTIGRRFTAFWEKMGIREVSTSQTTLRKMYTTHTKC